MSQKSSRKLQLEVRRAAAAARRRGATPLRGPTRGTRARGPGAYYFSSAAGDALRAQFLGLLTSNAAAFVRVLDAKVKKEQPAAPAA